MLTICRALRTRLAAESGDSCHSVSSQVLLPGRVPGQRLSRIFLRRAASFHSPYTRTYTARLTAGRRSQQRRICLRARASSELPEVTIIQRCGLNLTPHAGGFVTRHAQAESAVCSFELVTNGEVCYTGPSLCHIPWRTDLDEVRKREPAQWQKC